MSGVTGNGRIKSRKDYEGIFVNYLQVLMGFKGFVSATTSGSFNSDQTKTSFGDMDLIVQVDGAMFGFDKANIKLALIHYLISKSEEVIVPFESEKYSGRRHYNSGEIVTVSYKTFGIDSCQIDNIIAMTPEEAEFKQSFLDMPAEKQGIVLGLTKTVLIEDSMDEVFKRVGIDVDTTLTATQEFEFNLSSVEVQLRKVTYDTIGSFTQSDREVVWSSKKWDDVQKVLIRYNLNDSFNRLLRRSVNLFKNPRSAKRMVGVFTSMISVKSGEVGKKKGRDKQRAIDKVTEMFKSESVGIVSGRFAPVTLAHYELIQRMGRENDKGIVFLVRGKETGKDKERNPFDGGVQVQMLMTILPRNVKLVIIHTGFFVDELNRMKESDFTVYAGSDRVEAYSKYKNYLKDGRELKVVEVARTDDDISATRVREALRSDNQDSFNKLTPKELHGFYDQLHSAVV